MYFGIGHSMSIQKRMISLQNIYISDYKQDVCKNYDGNANSFVFRKHSTCIKCFCFSMKLWTKIGYKSMSLKFKTVYTDLALTFYASAP